MLIYVGGCLCAWPGAKAARLSSRERRWRTPSVHARSSTPLCPKRAAMGRLTLPTRTRTHMLRRQRRLRRCTTRTQQQRQRRQRRAPMEDRCRAHTPQRLRTLRPPMRTQRRRRRRRRPGAIHTGPLRTRPAQHRAQRPMVPPQATGTGDRPQSNRGRGGVSPRGVRVGGRVCRAAGLGAFFVGLATT
jgi:hypothetical protein